MVLRRSDVTRQWQARIFIEWLLHGEKCSDFGLSRSSFYRAVQWCWQVEVPRPQVTAAVYDWVMVDGIYLPYGWCLLTAVSVDGLIGWQWCKRENSASYQALFTAFPPPLVVVCDGGSGVFKAVRQTWPTTVMQRCLYHVWTNTRSDLTLKPRTLAGKELLTLGRALLTLETPTQAIAWQESLHNWWQQYGHLTKEKTYPAHPKLGQPTSWYTHEKLRNAYHRLNRLTHNKTLFTYLHPTYQHLNIPRTTNKLEGNINAGIRDLLHTHRGLSENHMKTAVEWFLTTKTLTPPNPKTWLINHYQPTPTKTKTTPKTTPTPLIENMGIDLNQKYWTGELHIRQGWAGRP